MIAIDCRPLQDASKYRGIGAVVRTIIEHIPNKENYRLLVEKKRGDFDAHGIQRLEFLAPVSNRRYGVALVNFLVENKISHCHFMAQYNIPENFDFSYSVTVHDLFNEYLLTNQKKYDLKLVSTLESLKKAKGLIAISHYTKKKILEKLPNATVQVIYNGFNSSIQKDAQIPVNVWEQLNVNEPFILYVGNFEKRKNLIGALKGFLAFNKKYPSYQFVACTGHKPLCLPPTILRLYLKNKKKIKLMSFLTSTQIANLYKKAAALMVVSYAEGFGLPVLEAMSVKTPSVMSDATALPEVGQNAAVYATPLNAETIARCLEAVIFNIKYRDSLINNMPMVLNCFDSKAKAIEYNDCLIKMEPTPTYPCT